MFSTSIQFTAFLPLFSAFSPRFPAFPPLFSSFPPHSPHSLHHPHIYPHCSHSNPYSPNSDPDSPPSHPDSTHPTVIPCIPIISLILFPDSAFRLLQIAPDLKIIFPCMHKIQYICNFEFPFWSFQFPQKLYLIDKFFLGGSPASLLTPYPRPRNYVPGRLNSIIKESSKRFNGLNID